MSEQPSKGYELPKPGKLGGIFASVPETLVILDVASDDPDIAFRTVPLSSLEEAQPDQTSEI